MTESRLPRFYAPAVDGDLAELPPDEAHHLTHVLRLGDGDDVAVFDGRGSEWRGRVERVARGGARVRLVRRIPPAAEPRVRLTLAQAILKGDKMDAVVRDATMLGASAIQPLITRRTIVRATAARTDAARERWRRVAIASAKQCRRAVVPDILEPASFEQWVGLVDTGIMLVEPDAGDAAGANATGAVSGPAVLIVGPEGGWDAVELAAARERGCQSLTLGALTLRAETAPVVAIAVLRARWGDF